ncbi:MAG: cytochrome c biogenesis CcdA family protein [Chloroflexota bacterium]
MLEWGELLTQFSLGNAAILTNVCLLPLYPGLIAFLAGNVQQAASTEPDASGAAAADRPLWVTASLGIFVLAGVLTVMVILGLVLYALQRSFADVFNLLLPLVYVTVIILGILLITGRSPFARMTTIQAPVLKSPFATAFLYGALLGPMTLPCTGPVILSAIGYGAVSPSTNVLTEILYFVAFGVGFGWPLLVLPLVAAPLQRRFIKWMTRNHTLLNRVSGALLVLIGLFGFWTEFFDGPSSLV